MDVVVELRVETQGGYVSRIIHLANHYQITKFS